MKLPSRLFLIALFITLFAFAEKPGYVRAQCNSTFNGTLDVDGAAQSFKGKISNTSISQCFDVFANDGNYISVTISRSGNSKLVPEISVIDVNGNSIVYAVGDRQGNAAVQALLAPQAGVYDIVVTRQGGALGTTSGEYMITAQITSKPIFTGIPPVNHRNAPAPANATRLGGFQMLLCDQKGLHTTLTNNNNDFGCADASGAIKYVVQVADLDAICQSDFNNQNAFVIRDGGDPDGHDKNIGAYNWSCYSF